MRLRHIKGAEEEIAESPYVVQDPQSLKGKWNELFGNDHPIRIEVGMGKGKFIMELAEKNPDINYVGIERYSSVLLRGLQKRAEMELFNLCEERGADYERSAYLLRSLVYGAILMLEFSILARKIITS